jgi:hypothetical protein
MEPFIISFYFLNYNIIGSISQLIKQNRCNLTAHYDIFEVLSILFLLFYDVYESIVYLRNTKSRKNISVNAVLNTKDISI